MKFQQRYTLLLMALPVLAIFYIGLFLTIQLWYPLGQPIEQWRAQILHFTIVFLLWLAIFYSYRLFDLEILRTRRMWVSRLIGGLLVCILVAALYFYFQPALLITPRRFLLVTSFLSGVGVLIWYFFLSTVLPHGWKTVVFGHSKLGDSYDLDGLISNREAAGLNYGGVFNFEEGSGRTENVLVVMPPQLEIDPETAQHLFTIRMSGVRFIEFHALYESLTRTIHLSALNELWFIQSIDYKAHAVFDFSKRVVDIFIGMLSLVVFALTFIPIALFIKLTSSGSVLFKQQRVGQNGAIFTLYKYRTMTSGGLTDTWTTPQDSRITPLGRFLRLSRLDELPQSLNILKGEMSLVGPRPEQVQIVEQLRLQIPYYDERHIVKPGLTGWAQLHVYAGSLEETKKKLQYDLYYIKHRSLLFDAEIILKTAYNIISFSGR